MKLKKLEAKLAKAQAKAKAANKEYEKLDQQIDKLNDKLVVLEDTAANADELVDELEEKLENALLDDGLPESRTVTLSKSDLLELAKHLPLYGTLRKRLIGKNKKRDEN